MPRAGTFPLANLELYQVTHLPNGLAVATAEMPYMTSASVGLWVGVGGRYEPPELNGVCHFLEHMLFKGTRKRTAKEISEAVEGIGGYLNAFTSEENTCFFSKASYERFDNLLEVLVDMFLNSTFETVEIDKERSVIKEELAMYLDQPHVHVQELLNEIMWPDHPLGRSLTGTERSLNAIKRPDLLGYLRRNYVTGNTLIAAAGNVRHEQVVKAVSRFAPRFPRGKSLPFLAAESQQTGPRLRLHTKAIEQTQLALGIQTCSRHDQRRYALRMLNAILGENMSSRLFQVVREENGLAYSISSSLGFFDDVGTLNISAGLESDNLQQTLKLIVRELRQLTEKPPGMAEVRRARDYLIGQIDLSLESTESQMMWLGEQILGYRRIVGATEIKERLSKVKPSEIRAVARDFLRPNRMNLALVSPIKSDKGLLRLLNQ